MKLRDCSIEGLGRGAALEFKVYLFRVGGASTGRADEGGEFLGMEGSVLDGGICEPAQVGIIIYRGSISVI